VTTLLLRVPRGGGLERQFRSDPPDGADGVALDPVDASGSGRIELPSPGKLVFSVPSPEELPRERDELRRAVGAPATGDEPLVIAVEAASELQPDELAAALDAAAHADRPVILAVLGEG
jgi:hypothetical protein